MKKKVNNKVLRFIKKSCWLPVCLFSCFVLIVSLAKGQSVFLDSLQTSFTKRTNEVLQEKVFVHTDKSFYLTGETLWFKAYVVNTVDNRETDFSKVVYVELVDNKSKPVLQAAIDNRRSMGDGSFVLPLSLNTGMYVLRAYTAWMKNFDEAAFFQTPIQVVNTTRRPDWASLQKQDSVAVQFFPEGGNLIDGIETKIGFQLMNQYGQGMNGEGAIVKNGKDTVVHFHPFKFGTGNFNFTPQHDAVYKAVMQLPNGEKLSANLPPVYKEGYVLQVMEAGNGQVKLTVSTNKVFSERPVYLLAHTRGTVKFAAAKIIAAGKAEWLIDKRSLGDGINIFTLFDADRKPICERLYFKRPAENMKVDVTTDAKEYATRSKITLNIAAQNAAGNGVESRMSLSVFLLDSLQAFTQPSIEEYLWLTSELKGSIQSPWYYFSADNNETNTALDNLLLTQGWRRFVPDDRTTATNTTFQFLPEYEGPVIAGKVVSKLTGYAAPNITCYLSAPGEKFYTGAAVSNETGNLAFVMKNIYGPAELAVQAAGADSNLRIELQSPYSLAYSAVPTPRFVLPEGWKEQLNNRHLNTRLSASFATTAAQRFQLPVQTDTLPFYGKADTRYNLDDYTRFPSMEEVMREITAEVHVNKDKDSFRYSVLNLPYKTHFDSPPLVLMDGVPVANTNKIISFDPLKVKRIDVEARNYFLGATANNGIVSYATYDGNLNGFELDPNVLLVEYNGLQIKREFYSPSYTTPESLRSREPDRRSVLLWKPLVTTTAQGKTEVSFFTSDGPGRYAVRVQGVSSGGIAGSGVTIVEVK